jgi:hypothetical protein
VVYCPRNVRRRVARYPASILLDRPVHGHDHRVLIFEEHDDDGSARPVFIVRPVKSRLFEVPMEMLQSHETFVPNTRPVLEYRLSEQLWGYVFTEHDANRNTPHCQRSVAAVSASTAGCCMATPVCWNKFAHASQRTQFA